MNVYYWGVCLLYENIVFFFGSYRKQIFTFDMLTITYNEVIKKIQDTRRYLFGK